MTNQAKREAHHNNDNTDTRPYWRRAHHHWPFWVAMVLMVAAITIYVMTQDLSFLHGQRVSPMPITVGS